VSDQTSPRRLYGEVDPLWRRRIRSVGRVAAWLVIAGGALALAGRILRMPILAQWIPRVQVRPMQPASAIFFVLGGVAVLTVLIRPERWARRLGLAAAWSVIAGGVWVVVANIVDADFPLWMLNSLALEDIIGGEQPARPAANVGVVLVALGAGIVGLTSRRNSAHIGGQILAASAGVVASTVVVASIYGEEGLRGFPFGSGRMAISAALLTILLSAAVLTARPALGLMAPIISPWAGGIVLRRLLPLVLAGPPLAVAYLAAFSTPSTQPRWFAYAAVLMSVLLVTALFATAAAVSRSAYSIRLAEDVAERAATAVNRDAAIVDGLLSRLSGSQDKLDGLDVAIRFRPAEGWLAGDSVITSVLDDFRLAAILIDIVGHGARPALAASRLGDVLQHSLRAGASPADALTQACWVLDEPQMMASVTVAVIDATEGSVTLAGAGCPPALHRSASGVVRYPPTGPVMMRDSGPAWHEAKLTLQAGDAVVLFSDGLADPTDPDGIEIATVDDLAAILERCPYPGAEDVADWCLDETVGLAGGITRDDASLLVVGRPAES
jgi:hypothetical protein